MPTDASIEVGHTFPQSQLEGPLVPAYVELYGNLLHWTWFTDSRTGAPVNFNLSSSVMWGYVRSGERPNRPWDWPQQANLQGMLDKFVRIKSGEDVERFARQYGVLELCRHYYPTAFHEGMNCEPVDESIGNTLVFSEPVERWLFYSRQAEAIINIAEALHTGKTTTKDDWRLATIITDASRASLSEQWSELAFAIDNWYRWGGVRPVLVWKDSRLSPVLVGGTTGGTFGSLAVQLMLAVSSQGVGLCDGCGSPYKLERKTRADRRNYCSECRANKVPWRDAKRDKKAGLSKPRKTKETSNG